MLVLTRRVGEKIVIGEGPTRVVLTVVELRADKVRLGLEADPSVRIMRSEILGRPGAPDPCT